MLHALIPILGAGGSAAGEYFLKLYGNASSQISVHMTVDSADNIIFTGAGAGAIIGTSDLFVAKFSPAGALLWAVAVGEASRNISPRGIAIDSSDNIFISAVNNGHGGILIKLDGGDGSMLARRIFGASGDVVGHVALDSSGRPHVSAGSGTSAFILKWQNDLTFIGQRKITPDLSTNAGAPSVAVDSSGNIFLLWFRSTNVFLVKWSSALSLQWQYRLVDWNGAVSVECDGTNLLVHGRVSASGANAIVAKISSAPAVTWVRQVNLAGTGLSNFPFSRMFIDDAGAIYVSSRYNSSPTRALLIKWNSGGVLQDQVIFKANTGSGVVDLLGVVVDSEGRIIVAGETNADGAGNYDALLARIPSDFSMTGTYGNLDYEASAYAESAGASGFSTTAWTEAAGTLSESAGSLTVAPLTGFTLEEFNLA